MADIVGADMVISIDALSALFGQARRRERFILIQDLAVAYQSFFRGRHRLDLNQSLKEHDSHNLSLCI